jgi:hypothetical protein
MPMLDKPCYAAHYIKTSRARKASKDMPGEETTRVVALQFEYFRRWLMKSESGFSEGKPTGVLQKYQRKYPNR